MFSDIVDGQPELIGHAVAELSLSSCTIGKGGDAAARAFRKDIRFEKTIQPFEPGVTDQAGDLIFVGKPDRDAAKKGRELCPALLDPTLLDAALDSVEMLNDFTPPGRASPPDQPSGQKGEGSDQGQWPEHELTARR